MRRRTHLDENLATMDIEPTPEELSRLDTSFPPGAAARERSTPEVVRWAGR
jgi:diketogulonate reductase-like aldo/keto reductase